METVSIGKRGISAISRVNYIKLGVRSLLFLLGTVLYILSRVRPELEFSPAKGSFPAFFAVVWAIYVGEMICRFFPVRFESMGCMKPFKKNYRPAEKPGVPDRKRVRRSFRQVALAWVLLNGLIATAYFLHWIDKGILLLISLAYGVCDLICVLFFCPFQTWIMKNRCCVVCHIYNWDFIMICTPLILLPGWFEWSMLFFSVALLLHWHISHSRHPERFFEETNEALRCVNCKEKLCTHKKQLHRFMQKQWKEHVEKSPILQEIMELTERK